VYYFGGDAEVIGDLTFNTTDGDIVVAVDGDFDIGDNDITVEDGRNNVTYYINGSLDLQGSPTVSVDSASRNVFYVNGGSSTEARGRKPDHRGDRLRPERERRDQRKPDAQRRIRHEVALDRREREGPVRREPQGLEIRITGGSGQNPITYLHVSENVVEVDFDR